MTKHEGNLEQAAQANRAGVQALRQGDHAQAKAAFERAVAADPEALPLWINLAHAHRLLGDRAAERVALDRALALDQGDFTACLRMAQLVQANGDDFAAMQMWSRVLHLAGSIGEVNPQIHAQIAAGKVWFTDRQAQLSSRIDANLGDLAAAQSATETRRAKAFRDHAMGRRTIYHNQCAGLHYPFLPADEYFDRELFPWLDTLEAAAPVIRDEFKALIADPAGLARPYVQMESGTPPNKWSDLDHSDRWTACFLWEYGRPHQAALDRCPQTAQVLQSLPLGAVPGRMPNAFFSVLHAHSHIPPHTGVTNTRAIIHLALEVPPGCSFRVGGETRDWVEGKAFAFDDTIEHEAWNDSDSPRAVLIVDCWNPHLSEYERENVIQYFRAIDVAGGGLNA
jgi:aspartyl/asparaginyl beta-hydroxylase (cupin superfamily)